MRLLRRVLWAVFFISCASSANSANLLILTTKASEDAGYHARIDSMVSEFSGGGHSVVVDHTTLTNPTPLTLEGLMPSGGGSYDLIVIMTVVKSITTGSWSIIQSAVANRTARAFVFFMDTCNPCQSKGLVQDVLNSAGGWSVGLSGNIGSVQDLDPNASSPWFGEFSALSPIYGNFAYRAISNVPVANILYKPMQIWTISGERDFSFTVLLPSVQSYAGSGACLFVTPDTDMFHYASNTGRIGTTFIQSALSADGPCLAKSTGAPPAVSGSVQGVPTLQVWSLWLLGISLLAFGLGHVRALNQQFRRRSGR